MSALVKIWGEVPCCNDPTTLIEIDTEYVLPDIHDGGLILSSIATILDHELCLEPYEYDMIIGGDMFIVTEDVGSAKERGAHCEQGDFLPTFHLSLTPVRDEPTEDLFYDDRYDIQEDSLGH